MEDNGILILCAHPDDHIIGAGGTIAKLSAEGKKVIVVIFSYGESGNPWFKETVVRRQRKAETIKAAEHTGEYKDIILGFKEGKFREELNKDKIKEQIKKIIKTYKIKKIFTHSIDDPLPDHRAVVNFTLKLTENMKTINIYSFNVWNPLIIRKTNSPKMYVDISKTFSNKIEALRLQKSQSHVPVVRMGIFAYWITAILAGLRAKTKYAEVFLKIK